MSLFIKSIYYPFKYFKADTQRSLLWLLFTIICGLIGIGVNIWSHLSKEIDLYKAIVIEFSVNSFYTYSIVLLSCTAGALFMKIDRDKMLSFTKIKTWLLIFLGIFVFVGTFLCQSQGKVVSPYWFQLFYFLLAIVLAVYGFCVVNMDEFPDLFIAIQERYTKNKVDTLKNMIDKMPQITDDQKGNKL